MKSLFAGLAVVAALFGAPAQAATTTFNFVSDCADCSVDHGPGTQATASLTIEDLTWYPAVYNEFQEFAYWSTGQASSFTYQSDWLGQLTGIEGSISYILFTRDPNNIGSHRLSFTISAGLADEEWGSMVFGVNESASDWTVSVYGAGVQDYGTLVPGAWTVAAVPEPETYAMLLAGLGVLGANAKRRKSKSA